MDVERFPPHALEIHSRNTPSRAASRIGKVAERTGAYLLSNSDAHHWTDVGGYYNVLHRRPEEEDEMVSILKEGAFELVGP